MSRAKKAPNSKRHASQQSLNGAVKSICDIMRRSNCAGALQYVPELTWVLFLDEVKTREAEEAAALGLRFRASLSKPFRLVRSGRQSGVKHAKSLAKGVSIENAPMI